MTSSPQIRAYRTVKYDLSEFSEEGDDLHKFIRMELKAALRRASVVKVYRGKKLIARLRKRGMKAWTMGREIYDDRGTYWRHSKWKKYKRLDAVARCIAEWR